MQNVGNRHVRGFWQIPKQTWRKLAQTIDPREETESRFLCNVATGGHGGNRPLVGKLGGQEKG